MSYNNFYILLNLTIVVGVEDIIGLSLPIDCRGNFDRNGLPKEISGCSIEDFRFLYWRAKDLLKSLSNRSLISRGQVLKIRTIADYAYWTALKLYDLCSKRVEHLSNNDTGNVKLKRAQMALEEAESLVNQFDDTNPWIREKIDFARSESWRGGRYDAEYEEGDGSYDYPIEE